MTAMDYVREQIAKGNRVTTMHKIVMFVRDPKGNLVEFVDLINNPDISVFQDMEIEDNKVGDKVYKRVVYRSAPQNPFEK